MAGSRKSKSKKSTPALPIVEPPAPVDEDLMDDLFAQLDSRNPAPASERRSVEPPPEPAPTRKKLDSRGRFLARQSRKAAALEQSHPTLDPETEARLEKEAKDEEKDINRICDELSLQVHEVNPDGHCLFSAIADQLALLGVLPSSQANYAVVRQTASHYIFSHRDDFLPFLPPPPGLDGLMTPELFEGYCVAIRDTAEWGGEPEIRALCRAYRVPIHVIQAGRPPIVVHDPYDPSAVIAKDKEKHVIRISYHRRMYGLGEHYNSLRPRSTISQLSHKINTILSV